MRNGEKMKFSIIIPVYNAEKYINRLIESIIKQTYCDFEIILINDGSTDNSLTLMNELKKQDTRIIVYNCENKGPGLARKFGYEKSSGELLFFIDSDDFLYDEYVLENINNIYINNKFDILFFDYLLKKGNKIIRENAFYNQSYKVGIHNCELLEETMILGALWRKIFVKDKMKEEYFYDSNNFEDFYTTYMYLNNCKNFYYTDSIFYVSDKSNLDSLTKTMNLTKIEKTIKIITEIYEKTILNKSAQLVILNYYVQASKMIIKMTESKERKKIVFRQLIDLRKMLSKDQLYIRLYIRKFSLRNLLDYIYVILAKIFY